MAKSREIPSVLTLMGGVSILFLSGSYLYGHLSRLMVRSFKQAAGPPLSLEGLQNLNSELIHSLLLALLPILTAALVISVFGHAIQTGPLATALKWEWSILNPLSGLRKLFSQQSVAELIKSVLKILVVGGVAYLTIKKELPHLPYLMDQEIENIWRAVRSIAWNLVLRTGIVLIILAGLDYVFQRWTHEKNLRMTKLELKEEFKQTEGDPIVKSRIRSLQRQMARRRMMAEVPKADVIITNPTHLAVALSYKMKEMEAPKVVAKGAGHVAEKIIETGRNHQVPVIENKPLARILHKTVEIGQVIPTSLYQAVADILAYVYRMKHRTL